VFDARLNLETLFVLCSRAAAFVAGRLSYTRVLAPVRCVTIVVPSEAILKRLWLFVSCKYLADNKTFVLIVFGLRQRTRQQTGEREHGI
jgi:hypothetical protein